jgi:bacteriocin-like protein
MSDREKELFFHLLENLDDCQLGAGGKAKGMRTLDDDELKSVVGGMMVGGGGGTTSTSGGCGGDDCDQSSMVCR